MVMFQEGLSPYFSYLRKLPYSILVTDGNATIDEIQIKKGDSLYSIARTYGITVDELKRINDLDSNTLSIGQQLLVNPNNTNNGNFWP